jgi:pimeloyl-ACP methyl ester carboxylesterase
MAPARPPGPLIDIGGLKLHIHRTGTGAPTVVLESALGGSYISWALVQPELARLTHVVSYDRAGFGWSDEGPRPRTAGRVADELRRLLDRAGVAPPFVLVGHSFGGFVMRIFAARHPADVAGIVLVDPAHPEDWVSPAPKEQLKITRGLELCRYGTTAARFGVARVVSALGAVGLFRVLRAMATMTNSGSFSREDEGLFAPVWRLPDEPRKLLRRFWTTRAFFETLGNQIETISETAAETLAAKGNGFGDLPLVTISRTNPGDHRLRQQDALARMSTRGRHVIASNSGHWIPLDEPSIIIQAISDVVAEARLAVAVPKADESRPYLPTAARF